MDNRVAGWEPAPGAAGGQQLSFVSLARLPCIFLSRLTVGLVIRSLAAAVAVGIAALYLIVAIRYCVLARWWLPRRERWSRTREGCCAECGYNLRGNVSGVCPECGHEIETALPPEHGPTAPSLIDKQPRWVYLTVLLITALTFFFLVFWM